MLARLPLSAVNVQLGHVGTKEQSNASTRPTCFSLLFSLAESGSASAGPFFNVRMGAAKKEAKMSEKKPGFGRKGPGRKTSKSFQKYLRQKARNEREMKKRIKHRKQINRIYKKFG